MKKDILNKILVFLIIYLLISSIVNFFVGEKGEKVAGADVTITLDKEISEKSTVTPEIYNNTDTEIIIASNCPATPFNVSSKVSGEWTTKTATPSIDCSKQPEQYTVAPFDSTDIPLTYWSNQLFNERGIYKIALTTEVNGEEKTFESNEFEITRPGVFRLLWNEVLYRPIFNLLILLISILPGFSLGAAIIILTLILRTILLLPSQKAMRAQKKMQEIQPKLEEIRKKYKGNQEKIAQETMNIWKTQKVNPFGSCLPLLIQFPILIALFYVIKSGLNPDQALLLYEGLKSFSFDSVETNFLGILELTEVNAIALPLIVGLLQFTQMKLGIARRNKNTQKSAKPAQKSEMEIANNMMIYFLPVMIAMFTASVPAGVGLYWGISTTYGIIQQIVVNNEKSTEPKVKVVN